MYFTIVVLVSSVNEHLKTTRNYEVGRDLLNGVLVVLNTESCINIEIN